MAQTEEHIAENDNTPVSLSWKGALYDAALEMEELVGESDEIQVERISVLKKIFPALLKPEDYSTLLKENEYLRDPSAFVDEERKTMLERVEDIANDNNANPPARVVQTENAYIPVEIKKAA